ncbi:unnamed protein product [Calicophoron daubneyi]|uniref:General vesicular transport factor p115 n=1 Tax=Calicophoron daubneyi TaxID=300641 RepID=A0AAV2T3P0_CALDB
MDIFRRYITSGSDVDEPNGADIVEKLVDRFQSATRIEDKRDALRTLKALAKKYRLEVGTQAMPIFLTSLENDKEDTDSVYYCLEGLYYVLNDISDEEGNNCADLTRSLLSVAAKEIINIPADLGAQFTEIFIKEPKNVAILLEFVDTYEPYIRRSAMRLIITLLINQLKGMQSVILQCPRAISKLVDILADPREALRNDALLLLLELTKSDVTIQKIVAFESTFERLLSIIQSEGFTEGGVVVEDCLRLLWQLLDGNAPNQILFKENNFIQRLLPLVEFRLHEDVDLQREQSWSAQNVVNAQLSMQIIRTLVSPRNKNQVTRLCQSAIHDCGLLAELCDIVMANGVPADVLTKAIYTVADVVRGCPVNQKYLAQVIAPSQPPQPAITVLLVSMVNERQVLLVRAAALYCFECYVAENSEAQSSIIMTLLPKSTEAADSITTGQLLCGGLFSNDPLSTWFSSVSLLHCIHGNVELKQELLRVQLASGRGGAPVTLLQQCFIWLQQSDHLQTRVGMLQFLCTWLAYCPVAVRQFLSAPVLNDAKKQATPNGSSCSQQQAKGSNLSALIAESVGVNNDESDGVIRGLTTLLTCICILFNSDDVPGYDRASLLNTLEKRIGIDMILEQLSQVSKAEAFTNASKRPEPQCRDNDDLVFDYTFTRIFKRLEYEVIRTFQPFDLSDGPGVIRNWNKQSSSQYEKMISKQENEITVLRNRVKELETRLTNERASRKPTSDAAGTLSESSLHESSELRTKLSNAEQRIRDLEERLSIFESEKRTIQTEQDDLLILLHDQDCKLQKLRSLLKQFGVQVEEESDDENAVGGDMNQNKGASSNQLETQIGAETARIHQCPDLNIGSVGKPSNTNSDNLTFAVPANVPHSLTNPLPSDPSNFSDLHISAAGVPTYSCCAPISTYPLNSLVYPTVTGIRSPFSGLNCPPEINR